MDQLDQHLVFTADEVVGDSQPKRQLVGLQKVDAQLMKSDLKQQLVMFPLETRVPNVIHDSYKQLSNSIHIKFEDELVTNGTSF